jgi:hypothetical protein
MAAEERATMAYRLLVLDGGHHATWHEADTPDDAIALGEEIVATGFGAVFIVPPDSEQRIPLHQFAAETQNNA